MGPSDGGACVTCRVTLQRQSDVALMPNRAGDRSPTVTCRPWEALFMRCRTRGSHSLMVRVTAYGEINLHLTILGAHAA